MRGGALSAGLRAVDVQALREAIKEFDLLGRVQFVERYGFSRSSKFYLITADRLYDTKVARDNQGETAATIRMRLRRNLPDGARA